MPIDAVSVLCAQLTRDLLAIVKFLFVLFLLSVIMIVCWPVCCTRGRTEDGNSTVDIATKLE